MGGTCEALGFDGGTISCGADCSYDASECGELPGVPALQLSLSPIKRFDFSWALVPGAQGYRLLESPAPGEDFALLGGMLTGQSASFEMPLHRRWEASYKLQACNDVGCTDSAVLDVMGSLVEAVGYVKASNPDGDDRFGTSIALSADGSTLAIGAQGEDSNATGIGGGEGSNAVSGSGAAYVFVHDGDGTWSQQAYVKASNTGNNDLFGFSVALSGDGSTLAVGAYYEDSNATGIGGTQTNDLVSDSGAVYVFIRNGAGEWSQQEYIKALNAGGVDLFGYSVALSDDGNTLAVGAYQEDGGSSGVNQGQDDSSDNAGAAYVFSRDGMGSWSQQAYVKASNTGSGDQFGHAVTLSGDGNTLAVAAHLEDSDTDGINSNGNNLAPDSGAVYVFTRDGMGTWSQQAYVKASNSDQQDYFGFGIALSENGDTLAVGAYQEDSNAIGIGGDEDNVNAPDSGAVYVFTRSGLGLWSQQAYVKAPNSEELDYFGYDLALSESGDVLAVGAYQESGSAAGVQGDINDNSTSSAGAVYLYTRDGTEAWSPGAYVKASTTDSDDRFGFGVAMSGDGNTLAIGAPLEDGSFAGIGGDQDDDSSPSAGAVFLY